MAPSPISAVAVDLDDTLYPESDFVFGGYRTVSEVVEGHYGISIFAALCARFMAGERGDLFTPTLRDLGCYEGESQVVELVQVYRTHAPLLRPFPDVVPALYEMRRRVGMGLISDGMAAVQHRKLQALALAHYFAAVVITDERGREYWKPHPWGYRECARLLGCPPAEMAYIGDNPAKDFHAARALGMFTIRVRRTGTLYGDIDPQPGHEAHVEVSDFAEAVSTALLKSGAG